MGKGGSDAAIFAFIKAENLKQLGVDYVCPTHLPADLDDRPHRLLFQNATRRIGVREPAREAEVFFAIFV